jgi:LPXTG-site transpeptidase (sortase) family protein
VIAIVAGLVLAVGAYALFGASRRAEGPTRQVSSTPAPIISVSATPSPVLGREGLRIRVPELSVDLPIVEGDGYNAPLYKAAHYPGSAWPGDGGRTVIYAHARPGMFGPLFKARVGEHIVITSPNGSTHTYVIGQYFSRWPITNLSWLRPGDHEEIVLVTCTTYNYNDPRIVAVGEPASRTDLGT